MDARAYQRYRLSLIGYIAVWLCAAVAIIVFWHVLPLLGKVLAVVVASVITPDVGMLESLVTPYERYYREEHL